jgi:hypothetical protein
VAGDLLQSIINNASSNGDLQHPLGPNFGVDYPIVQYADDTLTVLPADVDQLVRLKALLDTFVVSTGLKVNFNKSCMIPINVPTNKVQLLASSIAYQVETMPFTYLGLPIAEFVPVLNRIERHLMGLNSLISYVGRLTLVNSGFRALPNYYLCTLQVPIPILEHIDKYRKHFLWDKGDINRKGGCLVASKKACLSKDQGGLALLT